MRFFQELKRRKVVRTTIAYLVAAFVAAQVVQLLSDALGLQDRVLRTFVLLELAAIPIVVVLAWMLEITREGVRVTEPTDPGGESLRWRHITIAIVLSAMPLVALGWALARGGAPAGATISTLAVLPFENTGGAADDDYFSDGMRDELAGALARIPGLRVAGRTSSYMYKGKAAAAEEIARTLSVQALITGTVRRAGDRLRVTAQLVGGADGKVVWDSVFESRSTDVFAVQDQFTQAIVAALTPALSDRSRRGPAVATLRGTSNVEAYDLYLKGRSLWLERGYDNVLASIPFYEQAIARDPGFARAYAGLAMTYATLPAYRPAQPEWLIAQERAARRAVQLDPNLPDARLALALVLDDGYLDFDGALREYEAALALDPNDPSVLHVFGMTLVMHGHTEDGITHLRRATRIDPLAKSAGSGYSASLSFARRFTDAMTEARRVLALDSTFVLGLMTLGFAQAFGSMPDSAIITLERTLSLHPTTHVARPLLVYAYAAADRHADAERLSAELHASTAPGDSTAAAFADLVLGDPEPLLRIFDEPAVRGRWYRENLGFGCNPMLDPLRDMPRFQAAIRDTGTEPCTLPPLWSVPLAAQR